MAAGYFPAGVLLCALTILGLGSADVYMHSPRGSNDRNCEKNVNRNNGNRLFDSQNNAKGGYACGRARTQGPDSHTQTMKLYAGSKTTIEWTNQHGCGSNPKTSCEIVLQYACEDTLDATKKFRSKDSQWIGAPRDGTPETADTDAATDRIPDEEGAAKADTVKNRRYGMHESYDFYQKCKQRERNKGLYTADQDMNRNDARSTRQNNNGNRRGLECPEERDYYPYWAPNPWRDIAVITSNPSRCPYYKKESTATRGECRTPKEFYGNAGAKDLYSTKCPGFTDVDNKPPLQRKTEGLWFNNHAQCVKHGYKWQSVRYDVVHPDSVALQAAQKTEEVKGDSLRYELFKLPESALCGLREWPKPSTSTIALTAENWDVRAGQKDVPTFEEDGVKFLNKGGRWIGSKKSYQRPLRAEFTVQSIEEDNTKHWKNELEVGVLGKVKTDSNGPRDLDGGSGYSIFINRFQATTSVTRGDAERYRWNPVAIGNNVEQYKAPVKAAIEVLESGMIKVYLNGKIVTEYKDAKFKEGPLYVVSSGRNVMKLTEVKVTENFGVDKNGCNTQRDSILVTGTSTKVPHLYQSVASGPVSACGPNDSTSGSNYVKVSGYFKPTKTGSFKFAVNKVPHAQLFLKTAAQPAEIAKVPSTVSSGKPAWEDSVAEAKEWNTELTNELPTGGFVHGPFGGKDDKKVPLQELSRKLTGLPTHSHIRVTARYWALGSWDNEEGTLAIDGTQVWSKRSQVYHSSGGKVGKDGWIDGCNANPYMTSAWGKYSYHIPGGSTWNNNHQTNNWNCFFDIDIVYAHSATTADLKFTTNIRSALTDEGWAVSHVKVYTGSSASALTGGTWQTSTAITLNQGQGYQFIAIAPAGRASKTLQVGVGIGNAAPVVLDASVGSSANYRVCATATCTDETKQCQAKAAANCECEDWSTVRPDLDMAPGSTCCSNPAAAKKFMPYCYCKESSTAKKATFKQFKADSFTGWNNDTTFSGAKDKIHGPFDREQGWLGKMFTGLPTHGAVEIKFKFFAIDQVNNERFSVLVDGKRQWMDIGNKDGKKEQEFYTQNNWNEGMCETEKGFESYSDKAKMPNEKDPEATWEHTVCVKEYAVVVPHTSDTLDLAIVSGINDHRESRSYAIGAVTISTTDAPAAELLEEEITIKNPQTNQETKKKLKWASCEVVMSKNSGVVTAVDTESQSDSWTEDVLTELSPIETLQAERQEVDCLDGASSTSRENQLGNARGTANDDPKIPHGLNANRYIWTVPNTPDKNCVLRLRYNISTSDYWAWNNKGTPMTDASSSNLGRRRRQEKHDGNKSPIMQDPYIGIGSNPEETFLNLALNTNQYGRTFQDRSHVFEIAARPAGLPADAEIINVNVRGKRGNIVQTYPAVEYDFVPNDLCLNKGDYVHFQWTGSDYNPARNPNDGAGSGDVPPGTVDQASRADRSNIVEQDTTPSFAGSGAPTDPSTTNPGGYPRSKWQNGAGRHDAEVAMAMNYPAGYLSHWDSLGSKYTGMFWKNGKPDEATIMKLAFLDQVATLKGKGKKCKTLPELNKIKDQNKRERDPENCSLLNAADTPYFDGGIVKMEKAGRFPFYSTRNQNFSNRNHAGIFCVADGNVGTCSKGKTCEDMVEAELLGKQKKEKLMLEQTSSKATLIDQSEL